MSKKDLITVLRAACPIGTGAMVRDEDSSVTVNMVTGYEAEILAGCLQHMRNVDCTALGQKVIIPIDETGYTVRAHEHEPEPRP